MGQSKTTENVRIEKTFLYSPRLRKAAEDFLIKQFEQPNIWAVALNGDGDIEHAQFLTNKAMYVACSVAAVLEEGKGSRFIAEPPNDFVYEVVTSEDYDED